MRSGYYWTAILCFAGASGVGIWFSSLWFLHEKKNYLVAFLVLVASFLYINFVAYKDISDVKVGLKYYGTEVHFKDRETIFCDSTHTFIGKTEKYIFIYNFKDSSSEAIPFDDLKEIRFKIKYIPLLLYRSANYFPPPPPHPII